MAFHISLLFMGLCRCGMLEHFCEAPFHANHMERARLEEFQKYINAEIQKYNSSSLFLQVAKIKA